MINKVGERLIKEINNIKGKLSVMNITDIHERMDYEIVKAELKGLEYALEIINEEEDGKIDKLKPMGVGSRVKVAFSNRIYLNYEKMVKFIIDKNHLNESIFEEWENSRRVMMAYEIWGQTGTILGMQKHLDGRDDTCVLVKLNNGHYILASIDGLELIK